MWPFKNKFEKIKREEVVNAIIDLEKQLENIENGINDKQKQVDELMLKGRKISDREMKIFCAKKINFLRNEKSQDIKRSMYLMYNIKLLNQLKAAIDDNQFFNNSSAMPLNSLLGDQKNLAKFLNNTLKTKTAAENVLTSADELFNAVQEETESAESEQIYGVQESDDKLLSVFEDAEAADDTVLKETKEDKDEDPEEKERK